MNLRFMDQTRVPCHVANRVALLSPHAALVVKKSSNISLVQHLNYCSVACSMNSTSRLTHLFVVS